jgi:hypothetical protein
VKQSDWHLVHWPIRPEDKLPPERKVVLVFVKGSYLPYCAYIRYSAGDINCPYFVVYRSDKGAEVWAWCDCLPEGPHSTEAGFYNANREGSGFPARGFDALPTQESDMKSNTYDGIAAVLNQNKHAGSNRWVWSVCAMEFTTDNHGQRLDYASAEMVAKGYLSLKPGSGDTGTAGTSEAPLPARLLSMESVVKILNDHKYLESSTWYWASVIQRVANKDLVPDLTPDEATAAAEQYQASETADKKNCSTPPCCGTKPCIFPDPFVKNPEPFGEGADPADPRQPGNAPLQRPDELLQAALSGAGLAFDALTLLADGFGGPDGRRARMQFDKMAEMAYQLHETLANTRIEVKS